MLNQALDTFKKMYDEYGDSLILDNYVPDDGTYVVVVPKDEGFEVDEIFNFKLDKKSRQVDRSNRYMEFICYADYNSKLIEIDKPIVPISGKVIQGNNYLSFIIRKESLSNGKLTIEIIDKFYDALMDPKENKYKGKNQAIELYNSIEKEVGQVNVERLNKIRNWIKENIFNIIDDKKGKEYLKVYFYYPKEDYENEGLRYYIPNIYNKNIYNKVINEKIHGLPSNNMGLNSKKPYLRNKTRKIGTPYLINQEEVMLQKKFFDYCANCVSLGKLNLYIDEYEIHNESKNKFAGLYIRLKKGKEVEIQDVDIITNFNDNLIRPFKCKNVLDADYDKLKLDYNLSYKKLSSLENILNEVFFNKFLCNSYFTEANDINLKDTVLKSNLLISRNALFDWFHKNKSDNVEKVLEKISLNIVKNSIIKGNIIKAMDQFNLRISLKEYLKFKEGESMSDIIMNTKETLRNKISAKDTNYIESDKEYFFAVGQVVSFFISKSKGKKKPLSLANPFINAKNDKFIKEKVKALYRKYNYDMEFKDYRFKNLYSMISGYEINGKIDSDMIIAGFLHSNLLYEKIKEEK
ncbi:type I-B CRISPR-associated protein Cas8b/Csh1 [Clostridium ihumii]|uniref:type I-B CRISPR-associated protein Cas8b/Csh1 n=1 Tax=Clostridium ihumii TaxID=1470356 RepID=UPI003D32D94A